jgi:hypothetical protein
VLWILYNFNQNREITPYPYDSPSGMEASLKQAGDSLDRALSVRENFVRYQTRLMEEGFLKIPPQKKPNLKYMGDQKPYQNIDPEMLPFILEHFPNARFLHIVRHPFEVVTSSMKFEKGTGGFIWKNKTPEEIMEMWERFENWVADARKKYPLQLLEVRYDQVIDYPKETMAEIFRFLDLEFDQALLKKCEQMTLKNYKSIDHYPVTPSQKAIMDRYGMKTEFSSWESRFMPKLKSEYHRGLRWLKRKMA